MTGSGPLATAANRAVALRAAPDSREIPGGWVVSAPGLPRVEHLNCVRLSAAPTAAALRVLAARRSEGLAHRRVVIEDARGEALTAQLATHGWLRERVVVMTRDVSTPSEPPPRRSPSPPPPVARELAEVELRALERRLISEAVGPRGGGGRDELVAQLAEGQAACRAGTPCRRYGAGPPGDLVAAATLFLVPGLAAAPVAQVEFVATLSTHRERGFGAAVLRAALAGARESDAALTAVVTDADDWPQVWYASAGFAPVDRHVAFVRRGSAGVRG